MLPVISIVMVISEHTTNIIWACEMHLSARTKDVYCMGHECSLYHSVGLNWLIQQNCNLD